MKNKRQKFIEGSFIKIKLSNGDFTFGRLVPNHDILCYDCLQNKGSKTPSIEEIEKSMILFYSGVYKDAITKGEFEIIDFKPLTPEDYLKIPPKFTQDMVNINDCVIFYYDGREQKAKAKECLGLERSSVWESEGIIERIEDHYANKRNPYVELDKVILSKSDIRYLAGPFLRWDSKKQEYYKVDKLSKV